MKSIKLLIFFVLLTFIASTMACNVPTNATSPVEAPPTEAATLPPTEAPIQPVLIPIEFPAERSSHAGDYDSSTTAAKNTAPGGDRFTLGRFERPFNANTMDVYFSQLDIVDTFVYQDDTWIFGRIQLNKLDSSSTVASKYALELDLDRDGKGDWLVLTSAPQSTDWSVVGVQVFEDTDKSVGGQSAMYTDAGAGGNGYETTVFDSGTGNDADSARSRISPSDPNTVDIAVKRSVLGNPERYLINMWAGTSLLDPALFDINDHFSHEQAGAADKGLNIFYPIKQVFELDNSCKMAVGFQPKGNEPGLCELFIPVVPGATSPSCNLDYRICQSQGYGDFDAGKCECIVIG